MSILCMRARSREREKRLEDTVILITMLELIERNEQTDRY